MTIPSTPIGLTKDERVAAWKAAGILFDANLEFVLMMIGKKTEGMGAVISNIPPTQTVNMLERVLAMSRTTKTRPDA